MAKKDEERVTRKPIPEEKAGTQPVGGQMGGALGANLQLGGFGNPMGFTPPKPRSMFESSAEQFSRLPEQPARPSDLFSTAVPTFPSQLTQPTALGGLVRADLSYTPPSAPTTDAITSFGNPMASRTERITSPYGTASTTLTPDQQAQRFQARQQAEEMGTIPRTPEQQQALLAQIRQNAANLNRERTQWVERGIAAGKERSREMREAGVRNFGTDRFGRPLQQFAAQQATEGSRISSIPSTINSVLSATGFGTMQRNQAAQVPPPIRNTSLFGGMGYAAAFGGGPQPNQATSLSPVTEDLLGRRSRGMSRTTLFI